MSSFVPTPRTMVTCNDRRMQGNPRSIANILNASSAYRIPPYQRAYQWEAERWQGLAHDVQQLTMKPKGDPPHWLGILLLSDDTGTKHPGDDSVQSYTVIDGQQRLTTTILWLAALEHHANDKGTPIKLDVSKFAALDVQGSTVPIQDRARGQVATCEERVASRKGAHSRPTHTSDISST